MKTIIKLLRIGGLIVSSFIGFVLLYLLLAFVLSVIPSKAETAETDVVIYVRTNGVHTDLVLPVSYDSVDWRRKVKFSHTLSQDSLMSFVAFGWGDRGFYLNTPDWSDLKFSTAFNAVFGLGRTVMHVTFYKSVIVSKKTIQLNISKAQYLKLVKYIHNSFATDTQGEYINIKTGMAYGRNDSFYEAKGSYSLFKTCNTWTNSGLKVCEQKACVWTPFDKGIFYHY